MSSHQSRYLCHRVRLKLTRERYTATRAKAETGLPLHAIRAAANGRLADQRTADRLKAWLAGTDAGKRS